MVCEICQKNFDYDVIITLSAHARAKVQLNTFVWKMEKPR